VRFRLAPVEINHTIHLGIIQQNLHTIPHEIRQKEKGPQIRVSDPRVASPSHERTRARSLLPLRDSRCGGHRPVTSRLVRASKANACAMAHGGSRVRIELYARRPEPGLAVAPCRLHTNAVKERYIRFTFLSDIAQITLTYHMTRKHCSFNFQ
jgi:hypothetical protein